ncbi:MAG TPA: 5-deoxy-glucuronate isomerase [Candidatus Acidoferrales bacterium]|nr:5-deoxy-glucuronate isomerase [Candidatus Acidoferrales bacterium]
MTSTQATPGSPALQQMIFRGTDEHAGRRISVHPRNSTNKYLSYGRIILNQSVPMVSFENGGEETGPICLSGRATVRVADRNFEFGPLDSIYIPKGSHIEVRTSSQADFAEFSSGVEGEYPLQFVSYAEIAPNPKLKFSTGQPSCARHITICLGNNVRAGRLLAGITISEPGNWTSWPPHEHAKMLEEMYVYIDMPAPAFALQLVYNDTAIPELAVPVREGDAVLIPSGYHPNVAVPGHRIAFLWAMAAHRETEDRQFGVVNVQPEFQGGGGSGLEASRK